MIKNSENEKKVNDKNWTTKIIKKRTWFLNRSVATVFWYFWTTSDSSSRHLKYAHKESKIAENIILYSCDHI